ncbi:chromosome segregation protein SMC [Sphingomonas piscis]|uniref:Chromosome partition protein Smc n=1 Tax=Sphingomonas piscis TaxID=2714943 RepID=A0A6G7YNV0_9SPHN|nr:chromosome segregation protein SMC [Sphingomonas piscis]QIK78407.1 chromosome segregation protein SMC [Sphingomonas piscis]
MKIKRLKLSGFKSFVEPSELRIEPGLTGIVGPNGCGKSNLLEALRWAMGEGSPKSLRGGGMEDVIFAGTATRAPRDFAEVSILIEREPTDSSMGGESEVTRRIERGSGSAYRLDGRDVRAKDVALLFADAATGAHSPALVSQNRIGAVIAAKPTERRQMLEEAAGISGLHARRKDAEQKLRATEANLARLAEILSEQEARTAALKRQARAAERYKQISAKIRLVEARLVHARWTEADRAAATATEEARAADRQVAEFQTQVEQAQSAQLLAARALNARRTELVDAREAGHRLAHQLAAARARRDTVARRLTELDRLDQSLNADMEREQALKSDAQTAIAQLEAEATALAQRLENAEASAARIAAELTDAETRSRDAEAALADLLARQAAMRAERRVAEAAVEAARGQLARTEAERARLAQQLAQLGDGSSFQAAQADAEARAEHAAKTSAAAEVQQQEAEEGRARAAAARDAAESDLATARATLASAKSEHDALARALDKGGAAVIASLSAEPGFEHALAAALGDDADAPIGAGGMRGWIGSAMAANDPALPGGITPLSDHVTAPAELTRRLLQVGVVETDNGVDLAVGQRLVTRDGRMRRWDGFVATGVGAAAAERLVRQNRLAELARELPALEQAVDAAAASREHALQEVERFRKLGETARAAGAAADAEAREAARAVDSAVSAIERLAAQRSGLEQRLADLDPVLSASHEALESAEASLQALPDPAVLEKEVGERRSSATAAGAAVADKRAEAATRARETAADRERQSAARREEGEWRRRDSEAEKRIAAAAQRRADQADERRALQQEPEALDEEIASLERGSAEAEALVAKAADAEQSADRDVQASAVALAAAGERVAAAREQRAAATARAEAQQARSAEYARICLERFECVPQRLPVQLGFDPAEVRDSDAESSELERLTAERERIGPVNLVAEKELAEIEEARGKGTAEAEELTEAIHRLRGSIGSLNREGRVRLLDAYEKVNDHFRRLFTTLFEGGQAHLELVESDDPLEAGLEIMAQPPGKRLSALTLLSGGEQALTAVALIFALFLTNPAPICVLDEVDAPLDDANVERFCDLLAQMTRETDTRYLIVTHNAVTMSRMQRLYGVTMIEKGISRLVSVDLGGAETLLAAE